MTCSYFLLNCLLLIPTRDPQSVLILSSLSAAVLVFNFFKWKDLPKTWEYEVAKLMHVVPLVLLVIRNLTIYGFSAGLMAFSGYMIATLLFFVLAKKASNDSLNAFFEYLSIPFVGLGSISIMNSLVSPYAHDVQLGFILSIVIVNVLSMLANNGKGFRTIATVTSIFMLMIGLDGIIDTAGLALLIIISSIIGVVLGHANRERFNCYGNFGVLIVSLTYFATIAYDIAIINPWLSLSILGTVSILSSSFAEKHDISVSAAARKVDLYFNQSQEA